MPYVRDRAFCLTCGGPAAICAASDRCVGLGQAGVAPPPLSDEYRTRIEATVTSFGWRAKAAFTAAFWLFGLLVATRSTATARPLLIFLGVPYVAVGAVLTSVVWRAHRTGGR